MKKILLIEDDQILSSLIKTKLEKEGYELITTLDGAAASALAAKERPDLVLLDFELPHKNGLEVLEEIRNNPSGQSIPVVVISNSGSPVEVFRFQKLGVKDYFIKADLNLDELVKIVRNYLPEK